MFDMIGPGGKSGCSKMGCTTRAVNEYVYSVAHPSQNVYDVAYRWCSEHDYILSQQHYPNFVLIRHNILGAS